MQKNQAFVLVGVVGVCTLLLALSGSLLMRTTEARLAMRRMGQANNFGMSLDNLMRESAWEAIEMATAEADYASFDSRKTFAASMLETFPEEWKRGAETGAVDLAVAVSDYPSGSSVDLMGSPAKYEILQAEELRSNLLPKDQNFIGRKWGFKSSVKVTVFDNLAPLEGSWYKKMDDSSSAVKTTRKLGNPNEVLFSQGSTNIFTITEIPSQFSIQGQNMVIKNASSDQKSVVKSTKGQAPTVLGKNLMVAPDVQMSANRRIVARGSMGGSALGNKDLETATLAQKAVAGASQEQELDAAGRSVLVSVGTRGPEIFRPPLDYPLSIDLTSPSEQARKSIAREQAAKNPDYLKYWLPYYQCNLRVTVWMPNPYPLSNLVDEEYYSVGSSWFPWVETPAERAKPGVLPAALAGISLLSDKVHRYGRAVLPVSGTTAPVPRPVSVVSRQSYSASSGVSTWKNTIDVDVEKLLELAASAGVKSLGLFIDIRDSKGNYISDAAAFPVVLRQAKVVSMPFSVVTPGTIYLQGPFASSIPPGGQPPFSLLAPKVRYGMVGRTPQGVDLKGQRMVVGSYDSKKASAPLDVLAGSEERPTSSSAMANVSVSGASTSTVPLPPVFLKDWLVESHNIWVDR